MLNTVLLCPANCSDFNRILLKACLEHEALSIKNVLVDYKPRGSLKKKLKKNLQQGRGGFVAIMALQRLFNRFWGKKQLASEDVLRGYGVTHLEPVSDLYDPHLTERLRRIKPDLIILVGGFGIIRKSILDLPHLGVLSFHHGNMRKYRGQPAGFWEIYHDEKEVGITLQFLKEELDAGIPVAESNVGISANKGYRKIRSELFEASIPLFNEAVDQIAKANIPIAPPSQLGKVYTIPNLSQWFRFVFKNLIRRFKND